MLRRLITAVFEFVLVTGTATATGATHRVYVERDIVSQELTYRPHAIGLSADGTFAIAGIRYQSYGGAVAKARARAYLRGCSPDCAQGKAFRPRRPCVSATRSHAGA